MGNERCPLGNGVYWENEHSFNYVTGELEPDIPKFCTEHCGELMEEAIAGPVDNVDWFDKECEHLVEYEGQSLMRLGGQCRRTAILSVCPETGNDVFAEEYSFNCPHN